MTMRSGAMAWRFKAVSTRLSPFESEEPEAEKLRLSADRRFSAISKLDRVRVEDSKKRLTTVLPRRVGTFLIGRSPTSANDLAVVRMRSISPGDRSEMPKRSFFVQRGGAGAAAGGIRGPPAW